MPIGGQSKVLTIRKPWPPNSLLLFQLPKPASVGSGRRPWRMGSRISPSRTRNHSQDGGKPFLNPSCPLAPSFSSTGEKSQSLRAEGYVRPLCRQLQQGPVGDSRTVEEAQGEARGRSKPLHEKEGAPAPQLAACPPAPAAPHAFQNGELAPGR